MKIGDEIVCIDTSTVDKYGVAGSPIKGEIYTIIDAAACIECGEYEINVGLTSTLGTRCTCGHITDPGPVYNDPKRFRKIERHTAQENCVNVQLIEEGLDIPTPELV